MHTGLQDIFYVPCLYCLHVGIVVPVLFVGVVGVGLGIIH